MKLMVCMRGEPEQLSFMPEIIELGAGIEFGSYGMIGIKSEHDWKARIEMHKAIRAQFQGTVAIHGPFFGMEYAHIDYLIRDVVQRRMDMTFDVAVKLRASRVILHSSHKPEIDIFKLQDIWLKGCVEFWQREICRWADAGIEIVLENDIEKEPDLLVQLADEVNNPYLGLCLDIGHQHVFSELGAVEWVRRMNRRLYHIHLHDNDRSGDHHWSIGRGTIDFEPFYDEIMKYVPEVTISLEVVDNMDVKLDNLRTIAAYFTSKEHPVEPSS